MEQKTVHQNTVDCTPTDNIFTGQMEVNTVLGKLDSISEVVDLYICTNLIATFKRKYNRYHKENLKKWKSSVKMLKSSVITELEIMKFLRLSVLMGQVWKNYWSTDPTIPTPIFPYTMSRNHSETIWLPWHFSDNSKQTELSGRLIKIDAAYNYLVQEFKTVYSLKESYLWMKERYYREAD
jgi:hypothetical protein